MAQIVQRGNSYQLIANLGYDTHGKKIRKTKTWKIPKGMKPKTAERMAFEQAVLFADSFKKGAVTATKIPKFEAYCEYWLNDIAPKRQNEGSQANSRQYANRAYKSFGFKRMDMITADDIEDYIKELSNEENGCKYRKGERSAKTIRAYIAFVSLVFKHAVKKGRVSKNPCDSADLPRIEEAAEQEIYKQSETIRILDLLQQEPDKHFDYKLYFTLMIYTGCRRGELLGLEYKDFDYERESVKIRRASKYTKGKGIYTGLPKTKTSRRTLPLPAELLEMVSLYKSRQTEYAESIGDKWVMEIKGFNDEMVDNDRLFTQWDGAPMHPNAPQLFFKRFCEKHNIRYINPHGIRHTHASIKIFAGISVTDIQKALGHGTPLTTLKVYAHEFQAYEDTQKKALEKVLDVIPFPTSAETGKKYKRHQIDIKRANLMNFKIRKSSIQAGLRLG
jgi:integrase